MKFDPITHTYTLNGKKLTSVSRWIEQFVPPFPAEKIAEATAKRDGVNAEDVLRKWELKGQIALDQGNWVHNSIEYYLKHDREFTNEPVEAFKKVMSDNVYHSEVVVHDDEYAGTVDLIEVVGKGKVMIHDFKTNNDLYKKNGKLLGEYAHLDNTPFNKYTLQLNKYKQLLEGMKEVEVVGMSIWHYKNNFEIIWLSEHSQSLKTSKQPATNPNTGWLEKTKTPRKKKSQ